MSTLGSWRGVLNRYMVTPDPVRDYFVHLPSLLEQYPLDVSISYLFGRVELVQNNALYCGLVKLHLVDTVLASIAIDGHPLFRDDYHTFYWAIYGKKPKPKTFRKLEDAENVRDRILHGKQVDPKDMRRAILDVLEFAEKFNSDVNDIAGFLPFGDLRGFKGRALALDKSTSRWVLRGIGSKTV